MPSGMVRRNAENSLRQWLAHSGLSPGSHLPSERELARQLGLTYNAVNRGMAHLIDSGLVQRKGYTLTYWPENTTASEPTLPYDLVIYPSPSLVLGFKRVIRDLNLSVRMNYRETNEHFLHILHKLLSIETAGILFSPPSILPYSVWEPVMSKILAKGIPCVCIGYNNINIPSVVEDMNLAMEDIFSHIESWGHSELALITMTVWSPDGVEESWKQHCSRRGLHSSVGRILYGNNQPSESFSQLTRSLKKSWKNVSMLVVHGEMMIPPLIDQLALDGIRVPEDISIISVGDPLSYTSVNTITCAAFDLQLTRELAFRMLQRAARIKNTSHKVGRYDQVRISPNWIDRESVMPRGSSNAILPAARKITQNILPAFKLKVDPKRRKEQAEAMINRHYELTFGTSPSRFTSISLEEHVNRPLNFRRGWLGDRPLRHILPGEHLIHGIPFRTLGGRKRSDAGAIVFHSATNLTGNSQPLPEFVRIPIGSYAKAIYILHGCGYAQHLNHFATLNFHGHSRLLDSVPLISLGLKRDNPSSDRWKLDIQQANIQDWWPDFPQVDFQHARMVPLLDDTNVDCMPRYLYTLEWINPAPNERVEFLEIQVNPSQPTTLGILAISVMNPS